MNIFIFDCDIEKNVRQYCDKHVVKQILEYSQILCSPHANGFAPYKRTHYNHPCTKWARECEVNYNYLCELALALCEEYAFRYNREHKSKEVIKWCISNKHLLKFESNYCDMTRFAQAMPEEYKSIMSAVHAYRSYFNGEKQHIAKWTKRPTPEWFVKESSK